jgi:hypothetical protein
MSDQVDNDTKPAANAMKKSAAEDSGAFILDGERQRHVIRRFVEDVERKLAYDEAAAEASAIVVKTDERFDEVTGLYLRKKVERIIIESFLHAALACQVFDDIEIELVRGR